MGTSGEIGNTWEHVENIWEYVGNTETPGYSNGIHEDMWGAHGKHKEHTGICGEYTWRTWAHIGSMQGTHRR